MKRILIETPIGKIELIESKENLSRISFEENFHNEIPIKETKFLKECKNQILEYFNGKRKKFTIPITLTGTKFQSLVWNALIQIPYGETKTYEQIAQIIGNQKACRAVGLANHNNPLPIVIPCHRVIGKNGKLTGYAGGINRKEQLILLEQNNE